MNKKSSSFAAIEEGKLLKWVIHIAHIDLNVMQLLRRKKNNEYRKQFICSDSLRVHD